MTVSGLAREQLDLKMAVWAPGSYLIREFPKNVEGFRALAGKKELQSEKISKNTWRIHTADVNEVTVTYRVYAFEMSVRTSFVDADHAFMNGTSIFMYVDKELELPSTVKIMQDLDWKKIYKGMEENTDKAKKEREWGKKR